MKSSVVELILVLLAAAAIASIHHHLVQQPSVVERVTEQRLRSLADRTYDPTPNIVKGALLPARGVAVASVAVNGTLGTVERVTVLEAPSDVCAKALPDAISKWHFRVPPTKRVIKIEGKLTFYCLLNTDQYTILNPEDVQYIGPPPTHALFEFEDIQRLRH